MPTLTVRGMVVTPAGEPLDSKVVKILPRLNATTYGSPSYTLTTAGAYTATYATTGSESAFDVEIVVAETSGTELGRSVLLYGVSGEIVVDLVIGAEPYRGRSEYRRIEAQIGTLRGTLQVEELGSEHIEYLVAKLDMDPLRVAQYIQAWKLWAFVNEDISAPIFYALLRQGMPSSFPQLLSQGRAIHARAIADAITANIVTAEEVDSVEAYLVQLESYTATTAVWADAVDPNIKSKFRRILDTAPGAEAAALKQLAFMGKHLTHTGTNDEFWDAVEADVDLGATVRATYEWTIQISTLSNDHMPLIQVLQAKREDVGDPVKSFRDLGALDVDDWVELLSNDTPGPVIGAPSSIPTDWAEEERILRYAETLERIISDTYPTTVVHKRIVRDHAASPGSIAGAADLIQFFEDNPDFELLQHELGAYLTDNPTALDGVADEEVTKTNLKKLQRLGHLAPRGFHYKVVKPLYQAGIHSAHQISRMTRGRFLRKFAVSLGGEDVADAVYQKAAQASSLALALAARFSSAFNPLSIGTVRGKLENFAGHADLELIFGNLDFCACEHCRSVFSAAAYYVDLLHFLENQPGADAESDALGALKVRRPELVAIELSCAHTNTEVPYIDLVNEILEYQVARHLGSPLDPIDDKGSWQTTWPAAELAIRPEHQRSSAYTGTASAVASWILPFNLPFAETSLYHQSFDISRERMLNAYPSVTGYQDRRARARLGLNSKTWQIIIASDALSEAPEDYWGASGATWWESLRPVSALLKGADLEIKELATLLRTRFIGRDGLAITYADPPDDCDLDLAEISTLNATDLDKFHRFIRLQRKLGWSTEEVDLTLHALGGDTPTLDAAMVRKLAVVHRLKEQLRLPVDVLLTLWSTLTTHIPADDETKPSAYAARFINRLLEGSGASNFALNEELTELADTDESFASETRVATVQSALGLSSEQAVFLENWLGDAETTLSVLSKAHRRTSLAKALGVSLVELKRLIDVVAISPFHEGETAPSESNLADSESFLDAVNAIRASAFTSEQIAHLLRHTVPLTPGVAPIPEIRAMMLADLSKGLTEITDKYTIETGGLGEGPLGERLRAALAEILAPDDVEAAMALLNVTTTEDPAAQGIRIDAQFGVADPIVLVIFEESAEAKVQLVMPGGELPNRIDRYNYVLTAVYAALRKRSSRELVIQRFAQHFDLEVESMQALLSLYLITPLPLLDFFADDAEIPSNAADHAYERVHKSARVISCFELGTTDLKYLYGEGATGWLDLDALPSGADPITPLPFADWKRLHDYTRARALFPHHPTTMSELRAAGSTPDIVAILAPRLGWDAADISRASTSVHGFDHSDYEDEAALLVVAETVTVARQLHTSVKAVQGWSIAEPQTDQVLQMQKALRGRYDESTWRSVAQSIHDDLRIERRDALVAYLLANGISGETPTPVASADGLYAYLLMDVEMNVCMKTSRIRFALNAVQQFVQRVFLALEEELNFDVDAESEWQWMKHYRLWEANRKVFLYPENWIDPALRDDKSPFFRELEETLLQGDITKSLAESAYTAYLEKLQVVAIPEVMGMYHEYGYDPISKKLLVNDLHVVARTGHGPFRHVYRKRQDLRRWTPWEELPGDIQSEHILPMVYGGRLYVFWLEFRFETVPPAADNIQSESHPDKALTVRLFWVEKHGGSWTSRYHAEGCDYTVEHYKSRIVNETEELTKWSGKAVENPETQNLEIHVFQHTPNAEGVWFYTQMRFILKPRIGRFIAVGADPEGGEIVTNSGRSRAGQRWLMEQANKNAVFALRDVWGNIFSQPVLFTAVKPAYSLLFEHDNISEVLNGVGFFFTATRHVFYVTSKWRAGIGTAGPSDKARLGKPAVNTLEIWPWTSYALLPHAADLAMPDLPADTSQTILQADALRVPLRWKGGVPGVFTEPLTKGVLSGDASARIETRTAAASSVLSALPTSKSDQTPGKVFDRIFNVAVFQHSYVGMLLGHIRRYGVEGLLRPLAGSNAAELSRQQISEIAVPQLAEWDPKEHDYLPGDHLLFPSEDASILDDVDFSYQGPLSVYNWEIFFHAPLLISDILSRQGRYEEADSWLRGVFDPTATDIADPNRFWRLKPFFATPKVPSVDELLLLLQGVGDDGGKRVAFEYQVDEWRGNPFNPHLVARLRSGAYQWATVMRYLDNLLAWGDARFAEDTIESINEATQIYMLAKSILGDRPVQVMKTLAPLAKAYDDLAGSLDSFSNALVEIETQVQGSKDTAEPDIYGTLVSNGYTNNPVPKFWYFCVPANPKVLAYWDVVEDRLFKIRNCQDIHGVERRLALFDPPIDPGQIVKALAGGGDLASALSLLSGRAPIYRFQAYLSKAYELASEVKALGSGLLQAYEKRDAEDLSLLRSQHERSVLALARAVREAQIEEADQSLVAAESARPIAQARHDYYQGLVDAGWSATEQAQIDLQKLAMNATLGAGLASALGSELGMIPNFDAGVEGASSPVAKAAFGGQQLAAVASMYAGMLNTISSYSSMASGLAGTTAGYERRVQDWKQQVVSADLELAQIDLQIAAARARKVVSEKELKSHDLQIQNAEVVDAYMRNKYTNAELYGWMVARVSSLYKQAYVLAYRAAVAAEKAYQYELHSKESFIGFGYWDQSRSGLLAGEILSLDLRRLDAAYLDNNTREFELTKRISLAQLDPYALAQLRETGSCYMNVPEYVFDLDHPGHYLRRIKMVSVALPGVTGPHVNVGCTLTLESSKIRESPLIAGLYKEEAEDSRFTYRIGKVEQIATSSGQDGTGMFESNINDARYLPFEGAGAIGTWKVDLPGAKYQFDYRTIADVVVTIQYTARQGGGGLRDAALSAALDAANKHENVASEAGSALILRAATDFAAAWHNFLFAETASSTRQLDMDLVTDRFPYLAAMWPNLQIMGVRLILVTNITTTLEGVTLKREGVELASGMELSSDLALGGLPTGRWSVDDDDPGEAPGAWKVEVALEDPTDYTQTYEIDAVEYQRFKDGVVRDMLVIVHYKMAPP